MNKKVLIVDDNPALIRALETRVESLGYSPITADNVSSAVSNYVKRKPDISLIDINLPDGNGFNVASQIIRRSGSLYGGIIFMTASMKLEFKETSRFYNPVAYLEKPFNADQLIHALACADNFDSFDLSASKMLRH